MVPQLPRRHVRARLVARRTEVIVRGGVAQVDATVARAEVHANREQRQLRVAEAEAVLELVVLLEARQPVALRAARHEGGGASHEVDVVAHLLRLKVGGWGWGWGWG